MNTLSCIAAACCLQLAFASAVAQNADEESLEEAPVVVQPKPGNESYTLPNGNRRVKVTPSSGEPYCLEIRDPDPFDELDVGSSLRIPCN